LLGSFLIWVIYGFLIGFRQWSVAVAFGLAAGVGLAAIVMISQKVIVKLMDWTITPRTIQRAARRAGARADPHNPVMLRDRDIVWHRAGPTDGPVQDSAGRPDCLQGRDVDVAVRR
jgi:hypothetical protein